MTYLWTKWRCMTYHYVPNNVVWRTYVPNDVVWRTYVPNDVVWRIYVPNDVVWRTYVRTKWRCMAYLCTKWGCVWRTYVPNDVLYRPGRDLGAEPILVLSVAGDIRVGHADGTEDSTTQYFTTNSVPHFKGTVYPDLGIWNFQRRKITAQKKVWAYCLQYSRYGYFFSVLQIRIRMFLSLTLDPDPLVRSTDPAPDPSIIKQK